jgi:hypothetical protein
MPVTFTPNSKINFIPDQASDPVIKVNPDVLAKRTTAHVFANELGLGDNVTYSIYNDLVTNVYGKPVPLARLLSPAQNHLRS